MNTQIFRKVSLARLSSPEQLDTVMRVTTPKTWLALLGTAVVLAATSIWGLYGSVATKASGQGVVIRSGTVMNVAGFSSGQLLDIRVHEGDIVNEGQVIATIAQPELLEKIRMTEAGLLDAEKSREYLLTVRDDAVKLRIQGIDKERGALEQQISNLQAQRKLVADQIPVDEELLAKGLITRHQTLQTKQQLANFDVQIEKLRADMTQMNSTQFETRNQYAQGEIDSQNRIAEVKRQLNALKKQLDGSIKVVSPYSGQVLEIKVNPGTLVSSATPIISLQPNLRELEAIVYIKAKDAKGIRPGMDVEVSPTNTRREEFGFIRAKIVWVADYPATEAALMRIFQNAPLASSLASEGPVTEVRIRMLEDRATPSGYKWSSAAGAPIKITGGTLINASVIVREQRPVSLVIPTVKKTLGLS